MLLSSRNGKKSIGGHDCAIHKYQCVADWSLSNKTVFLFCFFGAVLLPAVVPVVHLAPPEQKRVRR